MLRSQLGNQFSAAGRSDFFVSVEQQGDLSKILKMECPQLLHGEQHHIDATFTVSRPRPFGPVAFDPKRPFRHGPFREYGIQMGTGHHFPFALPLENSQQMAAFLGILHRDLLQGKRMQRFQFLPQKVRHLIDALSVPGSTVHIDQFLPVGDVRGKRFFTSLI